MVTCPNCSTPCVEANDERKVVVTPTKHSQQFTFTVESFSCGYCDRDFDHATYGGEA